MKYISKFSRDKKHRYLFELYFDHLNNHNKNHFTFILLNPTPLDPIKLNATVKRCIGFTKKWGGGSLSIVNLYSVLEKDPKKIHTHNRPSLTTNDKYILKSVQKAHKVILGWGDLDQSHQNRIDRVLKLLEDRPVYCLKINKSGHPGHPLYLRKDSTLLPYK